MKIKPGKIAYPLYFTKEELEAFEVLISTTHLPIDSTIKERFLSQAERGLRILFLEEEKRFEQLEGRREYEEAGITDVI